MSAAAAVASLVSRGETVATCESLTGGLVVAELTGIPGSSAVVRGGLVTYAVDLKTALAGVDAGLIQEHGVVSEETAAAMAEAARRACGADWGVATTGVAGPDAHGGCPPGTVWVAVSGPSYGASRLLHLDGDRAQVRAETVRKVLDLLADAVG